MHTIDLLKGQGIPPKTTFGGAVCTALILIFPLLVGAALIGMYASNKTTLESRKYRAEKLKETLSGLLPNTQETANIRKEKNSYIIKLQEASKCIDTYYQWTSVLIPLVENLPDNMLMDKIFVTNTSQGSIKKSSDPNAPLVVPIPKKKMTIELHGLGSDSYTELVQGYREKLNSEESLNPVLENVTYVKEATSPVNPNEKFTMSLVFEKKKK